MLATESILLLLRRTQKAKLKLRMVEARQLSFLRFPTLQTSLYIITIIALSILKRLKVYFGFGWAYADERSAKLRSHKMIFLWQNFHTVTAHQVYVGQPSVQPSPKLSTLCNWKLGFTAFSKRRYISILFAVDSSCAGALCKLLRITWSPVSEEVERFSCICEQNSGYVCIHKLGTCYDSFYFWGSSTHNLKWSWNKIWFIRNKNL